MTQTDLQTILNNLLWSKLPDVLMDAQKERKISKILTEMKEEKKIINTGKDARPNWQAIIHNN